MALSVDDHFVNLLRHLRSCLFYHYSTFMNHTSDWVKFKSLSYWLSEPFFSKKIDVGISYPLAVIQTSFCNVLPYTKMIFLLTSYTIFWGNKCIWSLSPCEEIKPSTDSTISSNAKHAYWTDLCMRAPWWAGLMDFKNLKDFSFKLKLSILFYQTQIQDLISLKLFQKNEHQLQVSTEQSLVYYFRRDSLKFI